MRVLSDRGSASSHLGSAVNLSLLAQGVHNTIEYESANLNHLKQPCMWSSVGTPNNSSEPYVTDCHTCALSRLHTRTFEGHTCTYVLRRGTHAEKEVTARRVTSWLAVPFRCCRRPQAGVHSCVKCITPSPILYCPPCLPHRSRAAQRIVEVQNFQSPTEQDEYDTHDGPANPPF